MITILLLLLVFFIGVRIFVRQPKFGKLPSGKDLERIQRSPNYTKGKFQNLSFTPDLAEGITYLGILRDMLFERDKRNRPKTILPSVKTNLHEIPADENFFVWFGHSSYYLQLDGKKILVDPVFSGNASPIPGTVKSFKGANNYAVEDIPAIDYLIITHDHWDHLDYDTVIKLQPRINYIITGLGVHAHLEKWGFDPAIIHEMDWDQTLDLGEGFIVNSTPGRHFSGRSFKRQQSIWLSLAFRTPNHNVFIGGDSGYDTHFKKIGDQFGPFDMAFLECGQYNASWKYIHMMPEEVAEAALDLKAKQFIPVHWGKFALAYHAWDEPVIRVVKAAAEKHVPIVTPMIGEKVLFDAPEKQWKKWWEGIT